MISTVCKCDVCADEQVLSLGATQTPDGWGALRLTIARDFGNEESWTLCPKCLKRDIKIRLLNTNTGQMRPYSLQELISTTYRNGQFRFCGRFTGLKDKTGKEIYEGDVVKWCLPKGYRVTMAPEDDPLAFIFGVAPGEISEDSTFIDTVEYRDGSFYLMCKDTGGGALLSKHNDKAEIIGNIYENAELVK